ncbi:MAG: DUF6498-containing protein [Planctomycetota bacterium]|jgi:hypothetical protein
MKLLNRYITNIPLLALVVANVIPLWGVLYLGWDAFYILLLYWSENLVIGFYGILKIAFAKAPNLAAHLSKIFIIPFFIIHYGGFMAGHGLFVLSLFKKTNGQFIQGNEWPCFLVFVQLLLNVIRQAYLIIPANMKYALAALFISHGISFIYNYLLKGEFAVSKADRLMGQPYARVVVMHIALLAGGFLSVAIGQPIGVLLVLVVLKIIIDVKLHLREHRKKQKPQSVGQI